MGPGPRFAGKLVEGESAPGGGGGGERSLLVSGGKGRACTSALADPPPVATVAELATLGGGPHSILPAGPGWASSAEGWAGMVDSNGWAGAVTACSGGGSEGKLRLRAPRRSCSKLCYSRFQVKIQNVAKGTFRKFGSLSQLREMAVECATVHVSFIRASFYVQER